MAVEVPSIRSRTDLGKAPLPLPPTNVTLKDTVVPAVAGFGEKAGSVRRPAWPMAEPTAKASISSASAAASTLKESLLRRRTGISLMS
jgi:hypothetical protein